MKIGITTQLSLATVATLLLAACSNSPYPGYDTDENGLYYQFHTQNEGAVKPAEGDVVRLVMNYKNSKDSVLFDSKVGNPSGANFIEFPLNKSTFKGSVEDAIGMLGLGDSASFLVNADSFYIKTAGAPSLPEYIEKGSMLTFNIKLEKITPKAEAEELRRKQMEERKKMYEMRVAQETEIIKKYVADNKITAAPTESGLYFIEVKKGKGEKPKAGQYVKVSYVGRLLDGTLFDTSDEAVAKKEGTYNPQRPYEPYETPIGVQQVVAGWDEGIMMMSPGGKAKLIVPSSLGYGPYGSPPVIPEYATLVFDVELVSVSDKPSEPMPMENTTEHK